MHYEACLKNEAIIYYIIFTVARGRIMQLDEEHSDLILI